MAFETWDDFARDFLKGNFIWKTFQRSLRLQLSTTMTRNDLIGKWKIKGSRRKHFMNLKKDGSVVVEATGVDNESDNSTSEWKFIDDRHWQLRITIPPTPNTPGLEDGAVEVIDYEVLRFSGNEMEIEAFDEEATVYQRVTN